MRVAIVHGSYGFPERNWFPWLKTELEKLHHSVFVPRFPTPEGQNFENWKSAFLSQAAAPDEDMVLIGHSVGAGFILKLLNEEKTKPVKASILVAGFIGKLNLPEFDGINETFVGGEFQWKRIKERAGRIVILSSDNDPYVPFEKTAELSTLLATEPIVIPNGGHLNTDSGFTNFPQILDVLKEILPA